MHKNTKPQNLPSPVDFKFSVHNDNRGRQQYCLVNSLGIHLGTLVLLINFNILGLTTVLF